MGKTRAAVESAGDGLRHVTNSVFAGVAVFTASASEEVFTGQRVGE